MGALTARLNRSAMSPRGNTTKPLLASANDNGDVTINWTVPKSAIAGFYSLVIHGFTSNYQQVIISFTIR
ncbi:MAG: hypothetical protein HGA65_13665 [Oscillochloris sp.]|nr:hypothetical protein [Oscillochloris sp.]